jgi:hypothetical protein
LADTNILSDGGFSSRKMWMAYVGMLFIAVGGVLAAYKPVFGPLYDTYVGGILGALGLFMTGNIAGKYVLAKAAAIPPATPPAPVETAPAKPPLDG